jgi:hypothetical protein
METIDHILTCCLFTRKLWFHILTAFGKPLPPAQRSILLWWRRIRGLWNGNAKKGADTLFALVCWMVWKERNARFREAAATVEGLLIIIRAKAEQWIRAGASKLGRAVPENFRP